MKVCTIIIALMLLAMLRCHAQHYDTASIFNVPVQMDDVVVKAARSGWDVNAFIRRVQTDTTFYKAFKSLRIVPYAATNDIKVYDKRGNVMASLYSKTRQAVAKGCRTMQTQEQKITGDFFKNDGEYNYYTASLYAYLFFTTGSICGDNNIVAGTQHEKEDGTMGKSKYRLKQLIFNPGSKVAGVPFIGDKAAVFDEDQAQKYDFKLTSEIYEGVECYVFLITPKPGEGDNVVFNNLATWFRKSDYTIVARDYSLSYSNMLYDFDVHIQVRTRQVGKYLLPVFLSYDGNWKIISKKRERVKFVCNLSF